MKYAALIVVALFLLASGIIFTTFVHAQNRSVGTAVSIIIVDKNVKDGNIIVSTPKGYGLTAIAYDSNMYGVYTGNPAIFLQNTNDSQAKPVTTSGKAKVLVSSINGNIRQNDFITTSIISGVGQKATKNGMILGTALENYSGNDPNATGKILVTVNPHYNASFIDSRFNILELIKNAADPSTLTSLTSLRYLIAAGIVFISFMFGFIFFGRVASKGTEALGRNPLASKTIQLNLIFNLGLMITIILAGLGIGYFILIL